MEAPTVTEFSLDLDGAPTRVIVQRFVDRLVLFVTQVATFGTLIEARFEEAHVDGTTDPVVRTLLGQRDDAVLELAARQVLEAARAGGIRVPILLGLGFRAGSASVGAVRELLDALRSRGVL